MIPDFLVIGAQKSGTTWLDKNLRTHPQLWLPPEKEIHYFDFPPLIPFYFLLFAPERSIRHWAKNRMIRDYHRARADKHTGFWYVRYYFWFRTRRWYLSLFTPSGKQIAGENTPRYSIISERAIAKVHALMPHGKIIYLLRNPIDRMWSDLAMYHSARFGHEGLHTIEEQRIIEFLQHSQHLISSRYLSNLQRWEKFYASEQIFIGFLEQIRDTPQQLLTAIYKFLGVDYSGQHLPTIIDRKVNAQDYPDIPQHIGATLAGLLVEDIKQFHQRFNNKYSAEWLRSAERYLTANPA
ncbi:MAG: sulfotransferase [Methylococcales bacterium]